METWREMRLRLRIAAAVMRGEPVMVRMVVGGRLLTLADNTFGD